MNCVPKVGLNCIATPVDGTTTMGSNAPVAEVPCKQNYYVPTKDDPDQTMSESH